MPEQTGPATRDAVKARANIELTDHSEDGDVDLIVAAVNSVVSGLPVAQDQPYEDGTWSHAVTLGANMMGARLYARRDSPQGVQSFGSDGPVYVQRTDPDVAMLLQLGTYSRPAVG